MKLRPAGLALTATAALFGALLSVPLSTSSAAAADLDYSAFEPGHIISDANFFDPGAMTVSQVQSFLDSKVSKCSSAAEAPCLKDYLGTLGAQAVTAERCLVALPEKKKQTAAQIIVAVATACSVSPRILLVTLQKEQGLVTQKSPKPSQYNAATGYACPDTPSGCDPVYRGFSNQVYWAARAFRAYAVNFNKQYPQYQPGVRDIAYQSALVDPKNACGSLAVTVENLATTALYTYTPYTPNAASLAHPFSTGDKCSSYGNRNFWGYYNSWFGKSTAGDHVLTSGGRTYLTVGTTRLELPLGTPELASSLDALGGSAAVSAAYLAKFTPAGALGPIVQDSLGGYFYLADGKRYSLDDCGTVTSLGFSCAAATVLPAAILGDIPLSTALAGTDSIVVRTPQGQRYLLGAGERRELLANSLLDSSAPEIEPTVDAATLVSIPYGAPIVPPGTVVSVRGSADLAVAGSASSYQIAASLVAEAPVTTWFGKSSGALDAASVSQLPGIAPLPGIFTAESTTYLLTPAGKTVLSDPLEWTTTAVALAPAVASLIPVNSGALSSPAFVVAPGSASASLVVDSTRRVVTSTADRSALAASLGISRSTRTITSLSRAAIATGPAVLPPGTVVRTGASSKTWLLDGLSTRIPASGDQRRNVTGSSASRTVTSSTLAGYPVAPGSLGPAITCGTTTTLAVSGRLRSISAADAAEFGPAFTPRALDSATCAALTRSGKIGTLLKYGSTYYEVTDGTRHSLTTKQYKAAAANGVSAVTVSKYFLHLIPAAR